MATLSSVDITSLLLVEGSAPSNPASGKQRLFVRSSDHLLCIVDSAGTVTPYGGALTNPMSAVGDLIRGGTAGAPTALAAVAVGKVLASKGVTTAPAWDYPPFHGAKAYSTTNQTINNTSAALTLDAEEYDTDGFHDNVTNNPRFTIPTGMGGYYSLKGGVGVNAANNGWIGFKLNGTTLSRGINGAQYTAGNYFQVVWDVQLVAGDYVELWVATTGNITVGGGGTDNQKWMSIQLMGV